MKRPDAFCELPEQCDAWDNFMFGDRPRTIAAQEPDEWIAVFELTLGEAVAAACGVHLSVLEHRPLAIRYDSASARYLAYPLYKMPLQSGLPTAPEAWRDIWQPLLTTPVRPLLRCFGRISDAMMTASQYFDDVLRQIRSSLRKPEGRHERPQVRAT